MIGGHTNSSSDKRDSDTAESYDPFTHEWNVVAKLNTPRHRLGVAVLDGWIYAVGGSDGMIHLNSMERYDIETNTWTVLPSMATRRMGVLSFLFFLSIFHEIFKADFYSQENWNIYIQTLIV